MGSKMKVKISYTTNLEDIPREISRLMGTMSEEIEKCNNYVCNLDTTNVEVCLSNLDDLRKTLSYVDLVAGDSVAVLSGYLKTKAEIAAETVAMERDNADEVQ
jgi:hypothetical protein